MIDPDVTRIGGRGGNTDRARSLAHASERLAVGEKGWSALLRDPGTGDLWEQTWPHSEEHGGGPLQLSRIEEPKAREKYGAAALTREKAEQ